MDKTKHEQECNSLMKGKEGECFCSIEDSNCNWCFSCTCKREVPYDSDVEPEKE